MLVAACTQPGVDSSANHPPNLPTLDVSGINLGLSGADLTTLCDGLLTQAHADFTNLETQTGPATLESVIGGMDAIYYSLQPVRHVWHMKDVHPDAAVRDAATGCSERYGDFGTRTSLSRGYYERLTAIDTTGLSPSEQYMVREYKRAYERAGVNKDAATRERIRALKLEITELGNQFATNIRSDVRYVDTRVENLAGLPEDFIAAHPPGDDGMVRLSTDSPEYTPVIKYAHSDELRRQMRVANRSRGYPANESILRALIEKRHTLAQLLGFESYAALSMDNKMIGTPAQAQAFLDRIGAALQGPVERELAMMLTRLQKIDPDAERVEIWQLSYLQTLMRQEDYALDSKAVRRYFSYEKVRAGIFQLTEDLFGVEIRPWQTETWHEDVESWEILDDGRLIGRFYMDNHPRPDKYKHAAHWTLRTGVKGRQIPLSGLAQNFPRGLMEHAHVETFLHEFGHLLHNVFAGTQVWPSISGMSMERDFVEAPSQMLEEWIWDYDTLRLFATDENGTPIPQDLVARMNRARDLGKATTTATQIYFANLSLNYYSRDPATFELYPLMRELSDAYNPFPYVEGTRFYANFSHLNGYASNYYMYQWSLAIATDLFSRFQAAGMRNQAVAHEYRTKVLGAAGSRPARDFVADFLGREFTPDAYIEELKRL